MQEKAFTLHNKGMNRDLSISKAGESAAYENHNIRIEARDGDTALSVTNERGNKEIPLLDFGVNGELIGWNVLDNHIVLFSHEDSPEAEGKPDHIYRVDYNANPIPGQNEFEGHTLFDGFLNFSIENPIESVVYHETDEIQKIYWVDGRNVLRSLNFMAKASEIARWAMDNTLFDSNKGADFNTICDIRKDYSGNTRPNGVIQYILTYYNRHGQESGAMWVSDLIYLSHSGKGGEADGTNTCRVTLDFTDFNYGFECYRVYSIFRSSENGTAVSYIVSEGYIPEKPADITEKAHIIVIDDYANQTAEDASRLMYLGSQPVIAGTLTHKDQTMFIGDIASAGRGALYDDLEAAIDGCAFLDNSKKNGITVLVDFDYETVNDSALVVPNADELYPYDNQLQYTSSQILTFKGGEKYRFAFVFKFADGTSTDAFWIGDKTNNYYPKMDGDKIQRIVAKWSVPADVLDVIRSYTDSNGKPLINGVQLMIAEATYADRSVKAQGILCPTVFNVWERYNNRLYSQSSWIMRPRNSGFANRHFEAIHNSTSSSGEIDCNYWNEGSPYPYYRLQKYDTTPEYSEAFDGVIDYDYVLIVLGMGTKGSEPVNLDCYSPSVSAIKVKLYGDYASEVMDINFNSQQYKPILDEAARNGSTQIDVKDSGGEVKYTLYFYDSGNKTGLGYGDVAKEASYAFVRDFLANTANISEVDITITEQAYKTFCNTVYNRFNVPGSVETKYKRAWANLKFTTNNDLQTDQKTGWYSAFDYTTSTAANRWNQAGTLVISDSMDYMPSYYKKHLMFVDENIVTLNSPELEYNVVSFDNASGYKLRIVGVAKITSSMSDFVVQATPGKLPGENLIDTKFSAKSDSGNLDGLTSWPLWYEYGLQPRTENPDGSEYDRFPSDKSNATSYDYIWGTSKNSYWLHMWNHPGKINGYTDIENNDYSSLRSKIFANLRVAASTVYNDSFNCVYPLDRPSSLRVFNYISSQYVGVDVSGDLKYYDGAIKTSLMPPGSHKYPVLYSMGISDASSEISSVNYDLMLNTPVSVEYRSTPHAVISLPIESSNGYYNITTLPFLSGEQHDDITREPATTTTPSITGALLPWINNNPGGSGYPYVDARINPSQPAYTPKNGAVTNSDKFVYIGEIYYEYGPAATDTRYGGTTKAAIQNNRFVAASDIIGIPERGAMSTQIGDRGDTYFQRWDCLKTKPYNEATNGVIDITSVMLETHINIDGRTDNQRGTAQLASIDYENFGALNTVYSQRDTYQQRRDLNEDFNLDAYRSTLTWTLQKNDLADIDEWTHITLASTLKLDGDRGILRALRRMQNNIIAFQDKGISEILFNSRTQLTTTDGVPVEIANSGKVDGKRYITNKYGCINKWSIVEGKAGLYFVDNINKAFCLFSGNAVDSLSDKLGFGVWFKDANKTVPWSPADIASSTKESNLISFYDREHSDVYLVKDSNDEMASLVYNENLQSFTSFFDYSSVPMISNVRDRLISFKNGKLWLQNEGLYCNFFGEQYDFWVQYRVTPEPFSDKIWTNFDYRADFYHLLDENAYPQLPEEYLINGDYYEDVADIYKEDETFSFYKVWDEYQTTGEIDLHANNCKIDPVRKKFRIWRVAIARAMKDSTNIHGLDRIRNPWINLLLIRDMNGNDNQLLAQLHDVVVRYFE